MDLLVTKVASLVVSHVAFGAERLPTAFDRALEGSLVDVDPHVDPQILFLAEGFSTAWECTLKGLGSVVEVHVSIKPRLSGKSLPAVNHLGYENKGNRHIDGVLS